MTYAPVGITAGASSFDVEPADTLDPELFDGTRLKPNVRMFLMSTLKNFLGSEYQGMDRWLKLWLAGSGVSFRWQAAREPKDLDALLGIDGVEFRRSNPQFAQVGDNEITSHLNDDLREGLWPQTEDWRGFEVTWYANPKSFDIRNINPYAAYDVGGDIWAVTPTREPMNVPPEWHSTAATYHSRAREAVGRYSQALTDLKGAQNPAHRVDAERRFGMAVDQAVHLFDTVHNARRSAFSPGGGGGGDFSNFLWQSGKQAGWVPALKQIKDYHRQTTAAGQRGSYGMELPDTDTLIRRAVFHNR